MRYQTNFLVLLLAAGFINCADVGLNESEEAFESEFHKKYFDTSDEKKAAAALAQSEKEINAQNEKYNAGESTYFEELNSLSDVPTDVLEAEKEGAILPPNSRTKEGRGLGAILPDVSEWYTSPELEELYNSRQTPPASFDATTKGMVTPAKDQMSCGSCAAFAATGAHETCMLMAGARFNGLDLSEQMVVDCGYNGNDMNGCKGAHSGSYGRVLANSLAGQSPHEITYPYLNINPSLKCPVGKTIYNSGAYVKTPMEDFYCSEDKLKLQVSTYGAAVSYIYASDKGFGNYANGVFAGCTSQTINHAVLVVGYGTENGVDYWLVKNSWGPNWGNNGMIKIKRGNNQCGIGNYCYAAKCGKTSGSLSDPPVTPPPQPIPPSQECNVNAYWPGLTGRYIFTMNGITSDCTCNNGICSPTVAGPSNACMYMCGKLSCTS